MCLSSHCSQQFVKLCVCWQMLYRTQQNMVSTQHCGNLNHLMQISSFVLYDYMIMSITCRKMVEMHKVINSTIDNALWKYDSWNTSLLFNTKEHSSFFKKRFCIWKQANIGANRHLKYFESSQISSAMPNKLVALWWNKYKCEIKQQLLEKSVFIYLFS